MASIRIPAQLRVLTGGAAAVSTTAATVRGALAELERKHPGIQARLFDAAGAIRPFIRLFVGADVVEALGGLDAPLAARAELAIIPAMAGGQADA